MHHRKSHRKSGKPALALIPLMLALPAGAASADETGAAGATIAIPGSEVVLDIEAGEPIMIAGKDQKAYVKISLTGFELPSASKRTPVNLALVLDRSSSMSGDKIEKAKQAAMMVLDRLGPDDIISVISYDSTVDVLVPATKATHKDAIRERIAALSPRGTTALFAGVSHGIEEVSKFLDAKRVNRVILLSDGQANVGPSSPNELGRLGEAAGKQGISVSSIGLGLGYNEDLMTQLALRSDGNHGFAETADQLATIFNYELGDVLSVVAQDLIIEIEFDPTVRPLRGLNREVEIHGHKAQVSLNQLYSKQEKYLIIEVDVPAGKAGMSRPLADVSVAYNNMMTGKRHAMRDRLNVAFSGSRKDVEKRENRDVMVAAVEAVATDNNRQALALRDQGKVDEAQKVLVDNARELERQGKKYDSPRLRSYSESNIEDSKNLQGDAWNKTRKKMRKVQYSNDTQQSY
jgi:Ca-activated chloride channel family protein